MITGEIRAQIDTIWDAFGSGGISNPLSVIEQITYLLFLRRLDEIQTAKEKAANRLGRPIDKPIFNDTPGQQSARWSKFKHLKADVMYDTVRDKAFPFMKSFGGDGTAYGRHMKDASFVFDNLKKNHRVAEDDLRRLATDVTYAMCCEIHGERYERPEEKTERAPTGESEQCTPCRPTTV